MGFFRFFLASLVLATHYGMWVLIPNFNEGVVAVTCFILISGYVMTKLINSYYTNLAEVHFFYLDRACRILPQFIFWTLLTLLFLKFGEIGLKDLTWTSYSSCTNGKILFNFFRPLDYFLPFDAGKCNLLPQAWSLSLETVFYILIPFILKDMGGNSRRIIFAGSLIVFLNAFYGQIVFDKFVYFSIPGNLFIFFIGSYLASNTLLLEDNLLKKYLPSLLYLLFVILFTISMIDEGYFTGKYGHIKEVLLGLVAGIPLLKYFSTLKITSKLNNFFGNLSYGLFLNHVLFIYLLRKDFAPTYLGYFEILAISTIFAIPTYYFVELPFIKWRHRLRIIGNQPIKPASVSP